MKVTKCDKTPPKRLKLKSIAQASTSRALPELGFDPTTFQWLLNRFYRAFYHSLQHIIIDNNDVRLARKSSSSELHTSWPLTLLRLSLFHSPPPPSSSPSSCLILALEGLPYSFWLFHDFWRNTKPPFYFLIFFLDVFSTFWRRYDATRAPHPLQLFSVMSRASWERRTNWFLAQSGWYNWCNGVPSLLAQFLFCSLELTFKAPCWVK